MRRLVAAEYNCDPAHPLATDEADFYARLVGLDGDDRGDAGLHEIDSFDLSVGSLHVFEERHGCRMQVRP